MKHTNHCHEIDSRKITSKADFWATEKVHKGFLTWLERRVSHFGEAFVKILTLDPEPYILKRQNCKGEIYFRVYDPHQDVFHTFDSEESVRIWLEERHHQ